MLELLDGGTGEELFRLGLPDDRKTWSALAITYAEHNSKVIQVHRSFIQSGSKYITANNYGITPGVGFSLEEVINYTKIAGELASQARIEEKAERDVQICGSLPPLVESYRPDKILPFQQGKDMYTKIGQILLPYVDIYLAETISSIEEMKMAVSAVDKLKKPVFVSWTLNSDGKIRSGESVVEGIQKITKFNSVQAILFNCCEPEAITKSLYEIQDSQSTRKILEDKQIKLGAYANRLTPVPSNWSMQESTAPQAMRNDLNPTQYLEFVQKWQSLGISLIGGCCGIGPEYVKMIKEHLN